MDQPVEPTIRITLRLPESIYVAAQKLAEQQDRSLNGQIVHLLRLMLAPAAGDEAQ